MLLASVSGIPLADAPRAHAIARRPARHPLASVVRDGFHRRSEAQWREAEILLLADSGYGFHQIDLEISAPRGTRGAEFARDDSGLSAGPRERRLSARGGPLRSRLVFRRGRETCFPERVQPLFVGAGH